MNTTRRGFCTGLVVLLALSSATVFGEDYDLTIITPHNVHIQEEFEKGFSKQVGRDLKIQWIKQGTGQLIQLLDAKARSKRNTGFGIDVFFGGGVPDYELAASKGYLQHPDLPQKLLDAVPYQIAGQPNYDPKGEWYSVAVSTFGILVNHRGLESNGLPPIKTWEDLASPKMFSWVMMADPRKSASNQVAYESVLQQYGWEKGWPLLLEMAANSRIIADSSSAVPNEIASGNVLAGPCIDFYAMSRILEGGASDLSYVLPHGGTAITPDPIAMLRNPPHKELAGQFIAFVLGEPGQKLWILPTGTPGGPELHALYRLPVRPDIYELPAVRAHTASPYQEAESGNILKLDGKLYQDRLVGLAQLMGVAAVDLHQELQATWKALIDAKFPAGAMAEWNKPTFTEAQVLEFSHELEGGGRKAKRLTRRWIAQYQDKYERIQKMCR